MTEVLDKFLVAAPNTVTNSQAIIPEINFTCAGSILSWTFGAGWQGSTPELTELQIWRSSGDGSYTKVGNTTIMTEENTTGLYQYPLSSPLPFQAGDILGYYQPARSRSQLRLLVVSQVDPVQTLHLRSDQTDPANQFTINGSSTISRNLLISVETGEG